MTNPDNLRPARKAAGQSLSLSDSSAFVDELLTPVLRVNGSHPQETPQQPAQQDSVAEEELAPEDVLFGPLALTYAPEDRHRAAWMLWLELQQLRERDPYDLTRYLSELHHDDGEGYCAGCGSTPNGRLVVPYADCPTIDLIHTSALSDVDEL